MTTKKLHEYTARDLDAYVEEQRAVGRHAPVHFRLRFETEADRAAYQKWYDAICAEVRKYRKAGAADIKPYYEPVDVEGLRAVLDPVVSAALGLADGGDPVLTADQALRHAGNAHSEYCRGQEEVIGRILQAHIFVNDPYVIMECARVVFRHAVNDMVASTDEAAVKERFYQRLKAMLWIAMEPGEGWYRRPTAC